MNINKVLDGITAFLNFENDSTNQTRTNPQTPNFNPQSAVEGWLTNLFSQNENHQTAPLAARFKLQTQKQTEPEPTAAELAYFERLSGAKEGKEKEARPRLPESVLSELDSKAAVDEYLRRIVERYYYFVKDIDNLTIPIKGGKNPPQKTEADIAKLRVGRDKLIKLWTADFQKYYDKAFKEVQKDAATTPMTANEMQTKATEIAVQRWNSKVLFNKSEVEENIKADKNLTLFVKGKNDVNAIELNDVIQGQVGDCFILAAIGAVAHKNPESVRDIIKDVGGGKYNVRLFNQRLDGGFEPLNETVNGKLIGEGHAEYGDTAKVGGKEQKEAWTVLIEKAYIQGNLGSYKNAGKGGSPRAVMTALTGRPAETKINAEMSTTDFTQLLKSDRAIVLSTPSKKSEIENEKMRGKFQNYKLQEQHAYVLQEIKTNEKGVEVAVLYNPWGVQHAEIPVAEVRELFKYVTAEGI